MVAPLPVMSLNERFVSELPSPMYVFAEIFDDVMRAVAPVSVMNSLSPSENLYTGFVLLTAIFSSMSNRDEFIWPDTCI